MVLVAVTIKHCVFKAHGAYTTRIIYSQHLSFQTMLQRLAFAFFFFFFPSSKNLEVEFKKGKNIIWVLFSEQH